MAKPIIVVDNLSKKYKIGVRQPYYSLRDTLMGIVRYSIDLLKKRGVEEKRLVVDEFWALKEISFNVMQGEVIGIIGKNGAGKSTLLKIISQITPPTLGEIKLRGRVSSLLNVGTGFHPELTGRENVFLNGAILGMKRKEIKRKFDEIVEFSEIEKFIDTPVKYYSSGMYMRLAFAVASHLDPEILIIDEVLAVGDYGFQQKCLKQIDKIHKTGRTVLFVSHDMDSIQSLSDRVLLLVDGKTVGILPVAKGVQNYLYEQEVAILSYFKPTRFNLSSEAYILEAKVINKDNKNTATVLTCDPVYIEIKWMNNVGVPVNPNFMLVNQSGVRLMLSADVSIDWDGTRKRKPGIYRSKAKIPANFLNANDYLVHISLDRATPYKKCYDNYLDALRFTVRDSMDERSLARGAFTNIRKDVALWAALEWSWVREK